MYTKAQFDAAVALLIGSERHAELSANRFNRADLCKEVAKLAFLGRLESQDERSLELVRWTATNLWAGDGCLGLAD